MVDSVYVMLYLSYIWALCSCAFGMFTMLCMSLVSVFYYWLFSFRNEFKSLCRAIVGLQWILWWMLGILGLRFEVEVFYYSLLPRHSLPWISQQWLWTMEWLTTLSLGHHVLKFWDPLRLRGRPKKMRIFLQTEWGVLLPNVPYMAQGRMLLFVPPVKVSFYFPFQLFKSFLSSLCILWGRCEIISLCLRLRYPCN